MYTRTTGSPGISSRKCGTLCIRVGTCGYFSNNWFSYIDNLADNNNNDNNKAGDWREKLTFIYTFFWADRSRYFCLPSNFVWCWNDNRKATSTIHLMNTLSSYLNELFSGFRMPCLCGVKWRITMITHEHLIPSSFCEVEYLLFL